MSQSCGKPHEVGNDDACRTQDGLLAAVADGAGGAGIFTREWAHFLVEHLPTQPILGIDELTQFVGRIWQAFRTEQSSRITRSEIASKFLREGSWATLAACWLPSDEQAGLAHWLVYGDSAVLHYRSSTGYLEGFPDNLKIFEQAPDLINWKSAPNPAGLRVGTFHLESDSVVILCSDALAQYLLLQYAMESPDTSWGIELDHIRKSPTKIGAMLENMENTGAFKSLKINLQELKTVLVSESDFSDYLYKLTAAGLLPYDDYTLVLSASIGATP